MRSYPGAWNQVAGTRGWGKRKGRLAKKNKRKGKS